MARSDKNSFRECINRTLEDILFKVEYLSDKGDLDDKNWYAIMEAVCKRLSVSWAVSSPHPRKHNREIEEVARLIFNTPSKSWMECENK